MEHVEIVVAGSAHKHGIPVEDSLHTFRNAIQADYYDEGFSLFIGPDRAGNLLEVGMVESDDGVLVLVHADSARDHKLR